MITYIMDSFTNPPKTKVSVVREIANKERESGFCVTYIRIHIRRCYRLGYNCDVIARNPSAREAATGFLIRAGSLRPQLTVARVTSHINVAAPVSTKNGNRIIETSHLATIHRTGPER